MLLQFKNEHIFYALEPVWNQPDFDYKFQTHINALVVANSDNDFIQDVEISKENLLQIYRAVSRQPEGMAAAINKAIKELLLPQLLAESNNNDNDPNEAYSIILSIQALDQADIEARETLIEKGKNKILE